MPARHTFQIPWLLLLIAPLLLGIAQLASASEGPAKIVLLPPGPGNPLGTRAMYLNAPGIRIHGTYDDASIGTYASHGCVRMHIPDAEWMFNTVDIGTPVLIIR